MWTRDERTLRSRAWSSCPVWFSGRRCTMLAVFSLNQESSSHILLIPLVSVYLLYSERSRIFRHRANLRRTPAAQSFWRRSRCTLFAASRWLRGGSGRIFAGGDAGDRVSVARRIPVVLRKLAAWRRASFSLLFLLLMVPLPPPVLERSIYLLQQGSTEIAYLLFKAVGVPVLRQGFVLTVPGVRLRLRRNVAVSVRAWRCSLPACSQHICFCERNGEC